ncbi:MAG: MMPL family transporter [Acidihalobacter sp.]
MKPRAIITLWALLLALAGIFTARVHVDSSLNAFLPRAHSPDQRLLLDQLRSGPAARLVLIGIRGTDAQQLPALSRGLAAKLATNKRFLRVANGSAGAFRHSGDLLLRYRYLLAPTPRQHPYSAAALHADLQARLGELASPASAWFSQLLPRDPTGALQALAARLQPEHAPHQCGGVWCDEQGRRMLLLAELRDAGGGFAAQAQAIRAIRADFAALPHADSAQLLLSGVPAIAVHTRDQIRFDATLLSVLASALLIGLLLLSYRSVRLVLLSTLPLASGVIFGIAAVGLLYGSIGGITLAFGITLLGVAVDYPVHLFSHLRQGENAAKTLRRLWPTLRLGVLTTALGYAAMIVADFPGLAQLGVFAATGLLAAALTTRWVLPGLLADYAPRPWLPRWQPPARLRTIVRGMLLIVAAAAAALVLHHAGQLWQDNLAALSPVPAQARALDHSLRNALGAPGPRMLFVVRGSSAQQVLQRSEALQPRLQQARQQGLLSSYEMAARYLPSVRTQRVRQAALPDMAELRSALAKACKGLPFDPATFAPFVHDIEAARKLPPLRPAMLQDTALGARIAPLLFAQASGRWIGLVPLAGVADPTALAHWYAKATLPGSDLVDLKQQSNDLMSNFRAEALQRFAWGALGMLLLLVAGLRRLRPLLRVIAPVALALLVDVAVILAGGSRLSLFNLVTLLLVAGVGVDYALFFNRRESDPAERTRTTHALTLCLLSTVTLFGILATSGIPVLRAIGMTASVGAASTFLFAWALAPQSATSRQAPRA